MDLINEYFEEKGYNTASFTKLKLQKKKMLKSQKRIKPIFSVMVLSPRTLNKIKRKITNKSKARKSKSNIEQEVGDTTSEYSRKYNEGIIGFAESMGNRSIASLSLAYTPKPIYTMEKYAVFEKQVRRTFHKKYKRNFPESTHVLEQVLNLMFETEDTAISKSLRVVSKQIQIVPDSTAKYMNVKLSLWDQIQKLVENDLETVKKCRTMPKSVFGRTLQNKIKIESNANDFKLKWHKLSQNVAHYEELETFSAVWKNITHLQTTRKFCLWLANNPQVKPPIFLETEGLIKDNLSFRYSTESYSMCHEYNEAPDSIVNRPHMRWTRDSSSDSSSGLITSSLSDDISDINIIV